MRGYNLELDKLIKRINEKKHKLVLLQLADGLKPKARQIVEKISSETGCESIIWLGSCYGACDFPLGLKQFNVDMIVQWGHNTFKKTEGW